MLIALYLAGIIAGALITGLLPPRRPAYGALACALLGPFGLILAVWRVRTAQRASATV